MKSLLRVVFLILSAGWLHKGHALEDLCKQNEQTVFACETIQHKLVSVCASDDISSSCYLVYRFGSSDGTVALQLPKDPYKYRKTTTGAEIVNDKHGTDETYVRFQNGLYSYVIYAGMSTRWHIHGVAVFSKDKLVRKLSCASVPSANSLGLNDQLGIPEEDDARARSIWEAIKPK